MKTHNSRFHFQSIVVNALSVYTQSLPPGKDLSFF